MRIESRRDLAVYLGLLVAAGVLVVLVFGADVTMTAGTVTGAGAMGLLW